MKDASARVAPHFVGCRSALNTFGSGVLGFARRSNMADAPTGAYTVHKYGQTKPIY
jgi:hypothetical protein